MKTIHSSARRNSRMSVLLSMSAIVSTLIFGCSKSPATGESSIQSSRSSNVDYNPLFGMTSEGGDWSLWQDNDDLIASSRSQSTPFVPIRHTYETSIPSSFASSKAGVEAAYG